MSGPRVVFGMAAYNRPDRLAQALESLLAQTYRDLAVVVVDDAPRDEVAAIVETYAAGDPRVVYEANPVRLGMVGNWRKAFERGRARYPSREYFAWASDHDIWHPRWLEVLVDVLDQHPDVVLAHPQVMRIFPKYRKLITRPFDTFGMTNPVERIRATTTGRITAGNCVYGLFRASAMERAGVFHPVLMPDRLLLLHLAVLGQFRQVPEYLWYREASGSFSYQRQRQMLFAGRVPRHVYVPAPLQHCAVLAWRFGVRAEGRPAVGRLRGFACAAAQLYYASKRELVRDDSRWREALRRTAIGRRLFPGGRAARTLRRGVRVVATDSR